ncbi:MULTISPECIES: N-acetylmuramoyl-L-alanine amidase-like domain-containing protein [Aerosakkonema]|uniref:N-acetylmuramoyl-L-alanine amidase-like domain-containing protein n=1 Tax=Aerosakkonema TaxID=1246629 RepID=UPI0035B8140C
MRKIFGLAVLGSMIVGGSAGALVALRTAVPPLQVVAPRVEDPKINSEFTVADRPNSQNAPPARREEVPQTQDGARFRRVMQYAQQQKLYDRPMGEILQAIGNQFLGAPYKANLLDRSNIETLVVTLDKFDCVLFVETVLAIARGVAVKDYTYQSFTDNLINLRYRDGELHGYCSRLHYFSEWISDNQKRDNVTEIASRMGGIRLNKKLNYISSNRANYAPMAVDDLNYQCFVQAENKLADLSMNYIPISSIRRVYPQLQPGDIVAVATSIPGLDVTHTGLAYRNANGTMGIIHASPNGTVRISRDLQYYVGNIKNAIGIMVARPKDPR